MGLDGLDSLDADFVVGNEDNEEMPATKLLEPEIVEVHLNTTRDHNIPITAQHKRSLWYVYRLGLTLVFRVPSDGFHFMVKIKDENYADNSFEFGLLNENKPSNFENYIS
jgi:hypothetical protein